VDDSVAQKVILISASFDSNAPFIDCD